MSGYVALRTFSQRLLLPRYSTLVAASAAALVYSSSSSRNSGRTITRLDYWEHDPKDFDLYIKNPMGDDLPKLLHAFDNEGKEVWPWIWTHPNSDGPHFVFIGINEFYLQEIQRIRATSPNHNILIIADQQSLEKATQGDPTILNKCQCGIVTDSTLALLNVQAKILMLKDERVIAYDHLTIVEP